jgi:hypothetical protein
MSTFGGLAAEAVAVGAAEAVRVGVGGAAEAVGAGVACGLSVAGAAGSSSVAHWPPGPAWEGGEVELSLLKLELSLALCPNFLDLPSPCLSALPGIFCLAF